MKIAFVLGEHSADAIGADLLEGLRSRAGEEIDAVGLGGSGMEAAGVRSIFDIEELSIIGVGAIVSRLPQLMRRVNQTARYIVEARPDAVVTIDSFTFTNRVAQRVRRALPNVPIVNVVPPAVWAYRPGRLAKLKMAVDHSICLFPFEPQIFLDLDGPPASYVGHPLMSKRPLQVIMERGDNLLSRQPRLLVLPGSRRGEIDRLASDFGRTAGFLAKRLPGLEIVVPVVDRVRTKVEAAVAQWPVRPTLVLGEEAKWQAFAEADAALAASGTVALELALAGVPTVIAYRLDPVAYRLRHIISGWTAVLPNLVVDHPLVPEHYHEFVRADLLGRRLERLLTDTPERDAQIAGFREVRGRMQVDRPPGQAGADIVLDLIAARRAGHKR